MSKELSKKESSEIAPFSMNLYSNHNVEVQEIILPRCLLMQNTSKIVAQHGVRPGAIVDTLSLETLANVKETIQIVLSNLAVKWTLSKLDGADVVYVGQVPFDYKATDNDLKEVIHNGEMVMREKTYEFTVILKNDLDDEKFLPFKIMSFSKSSRKTGQQLASYFNTKIAEASTGVQTAPFDRFFNISSELLYNDKKQPYYVLNQTAGEKLTMPQFKKAYEYTSRMMNSIQKGSVKVHDLADEDDVKPVIAKKVAPATKSVTDNF